MNRRRFLQSLAAVFTLPAMPALSLRSAAAVVPVATEVPKQARFWAIYMSALHGECTPQTLQNMLHIPATDAKNYIAQLVMEGTIKPNPFVQKTVSEFVRAKDDGLLDKIRQRLEKKAEARSQPLPEQVEEEDLPSDEVEILEERQSDLELQENLDESINDELTSIDHQDEEALETSR